MLMLMPPCSVWRRAPGSDQPSLYREPRLHRWTLRSLRRGWKSSWTFKISHHVRREQLKRPICTLGIESCDWHQGRGHLHQTRWWKCCRSGSSWRRPCPRTWSWPRCWGSQEEQWLRGQEFLRHSHKGLPGGITILMHSIHFSTTVESPTKTGSEAQDRSSERPCNECSLSEEHKTGKK